MSPMGVVTARYVCSRFINYLTFPEDYFVNMLSNVRVILNCSFFPK